MGRKSIRREIERQRHRFEIMEAAVRVFARRGYREATIDEIAEEARFGKGTIYNYFESKEHLFTEIIKMLFDEMESFAKEAVKKFPRNLNVASTISLATGKNVEVEVYAENLESNIHEVLAKWEFGEIYVRVENVPSKNVKSSYLAALSALSLLRNLKEEVVVW